MIYAIALPIGRFICWLFGGLRVYNRRYMPKEGACVLVGNHLSAWDPILVACACKDRHLTFMGKEELFRNRFTNWFFRQLGGFPIKRGGTDMTAIKTALSRLKDGWALSIFPEGTRHADATQMQEARQGAAMLTLRSHAQLIPLAIFGRFRMLRFRKTHIVLGPPIDTAPFAAGKGDVPGLTAEIMRVVQAMQQEGVPTKQKRKRQA